MDYNPCPHLAALVTDYLENEEIQRMEWFTYSVHLYPIERVWGALGYRLASLNPAFITLPKLQGVIPHEYILLLQELLNNLVHSMENSYKTYIPVRGYCASY